MKKVLWLAPYPYNYLRAGADAHGHPAPWITELATELKDDVKLTIVNYSHRMKKDIDEFEEDGIRFAFIKSPRFRYDLFTIYRIRLNRLLQYLGDVKAEFDLIHVHGTEHQYECLAEKLRIPYIVSIQGIINLCRPYHPNKLSPIYAGWCLTSFYEKYGIKMAKYFFCRTEWDSKFVNRLNPKAKIFSNWELIRGSFFQNLFNPESKNLLFMSGTNLFKGIREALGCINLLKRRGIDLKLRVCGNGKWDEIEKFVLKNKLNIQKDEISFLGFQTAEQLSNEFKNSFCLIHPSYMDNSPNSICEAQVAGLPVVASKVGGVSSLIDDGTTGLLVERYDYENLANQVIKLIEKRDLYATISQGSRAVARKRHNREKIVANTLEAYEKVERSRLS